MCSNRSDSVLCNSKQLKQKMLTMKLNEIKSYTFANENKSPVNKIQLSPKKKDTDCGHSMEAAESRHSDNMTNIMGRGTAMTVLGLWRTRSLAERNTSELVITREEVVTAFRKELASLASGGRHHRGYTRSDLQDACRTLCSRMKHNRLKLKIDKSSSPEAWLDILYDFYCDLIKGTYWEDFQKANVTRWWQKETFQTDVFSAFCHLCEGLTRSAHSTQYWQFHYSSARHRLECAYASLNHSGDQLTNKKIQIPWPCIISLSLISKCPLKFYL